MLYFHVRVALLKCDFLRVPCTESWTSWAQMKAENLRNSKMGLHVPIAASKLELLASKRNRAFFLEHPVDGWKKVEFQIGDRQTDIRTCRAVSLLGHKRKIDLEATAM